MKTFLRNLPGYQTIRSQYKRYRHQQAREKLLKLMPKNSICAEIGVDEGQFSKKILKIVKPLCLHLIDPWKYESATEYTSACYGGKRGHGQPHMNQKYEAAMKKFSKRIKDGIVIIHRGYSYDVCSKFEPEFFDWIYLDGNHRYEFVIKDLEMYYPKIKSGGYISGDDYFMGGWWKGGVKRAVDDFVKRGFVKDLTIFGTNFMILK